MKNKHIVLIYPRPTQGYAKERRRDVHSVKRFYPALSIMVLASTLEAAGFPVLLLDHRLNTTDELFNKISNLDEILFIGISTMTGSQIMNGLDIAKRLRSKYDKDVPLVWGGVHPTIFPEKTILHPFVDIIVYGEADHTIVELAKAIAGDKSLDSVHGLYFKNNGKIIKTPASAQIDSLNVLPMPAWHHFAEYLNPAQYPILATLTTSRGCPFNCTYCYKGGIDIGVAKPWRPFGVVRIVDEADYLNRNFGFDVFEMSDENFILDVDRAVEIIRIFKNKGYKISAIRSNFNTYHDRVIKELPGFCDYVAYSPETGSSRIQAILNKKASYGKMKLLNKRLCDMGIATVHTFIFGFPFETEEDIRATVNLCKDFKNINPAARMAIYQYMPYPGAPLTDMMTSQYGLIFPDRFEEWSKTDMYGDLDLKFRPWVDEEKVEFLNRLQLFFNIAFNTYGELDPEAYEIYNSDPKIRELIGDISSIPRIAKSPFHYVLNDRLTSNLLGRYTERVFI